ncbi:MAG: cell division protein FtsL [Rubrivivax sp.]|jgi:cell division protein FtsL|nr:cell division protein FtsL [Rubrivivax sp.]
MLTRLNLMLLVALLGSALLLVQTSYDSRRLFSANQRAEAEAARIEIDYKRLDAQRQQQSTTPRVASDATVRLQMRKPPQTVEVFEAPPAGARL